MGERGVSLDYNASVPMEVKSTISVGPLAPLSVAKDRDFIPSKEKLADMAGNPIKPVRSLSMTDVVQDGADFQTSQATAEHAARRKELIKKLAQELWDSQAVYRKEYAKAKEVVEALTATQLEDPDKEQRKALAIVAKRPPLTKEEAVAKAKARVLMGTNRRA